VNDRAAAIFYHRWQRVLRHQKRTLETGIDGLVPLLFRAIRDVLRVEYTCIVEQDIDLAEMLERLFNGFTTIFGKTHIGSDEQSLTTSCFDLLNNLFAALRVAPRNRYCRALAHETHCGRTADARGSAGYQGYLSFQSHYCGLLYLLIHVPIGCRVRRWFPRHP